jgi:succinate dehydrogenase hydrophobic anchor subunit
VDDLIHSSRSSWSQRMEQRVSGVKLVLFHVVVAIASAIVAPGCYNQVLAPIINFIRRANSTLDSFGNLFVLETLIDSGVSSCGREHTIILLLMDLAGTRTNY